MFKDFFLGCFKNIKKLSRTGRSLEAYKIVSIFPFCTLPLITAKNTFGMMKNLVAIENCHYLINYSFGYVLRNFVTNELRYFHASGGTDRVLLSSRLISRTEDLMEFLLSISDDDLFHSTRRPDSQWIVDKATNITFFLTKRINCPIGCQNLANFVMDPRSSCIDSKLQNWEDVR